VKRQVLILILIVLADGCAYRSGPKDNQDFYNVSHLSELAGVYKNQGEPSGNLSVVNYLSQVIWGNNSARGAIGPHQRIELIEVIATVEVIATENSLTVKAIEHDCVTVGRDFEIANGKIVIHRELHVLTRGPGDFLLGPSYETVALGIDTGKHGKYRDSTYAAGLVVLLPVAVSETRDIRFQRVEDGPHGFPRCSSR
jgi:hypothetical protein